MEGHWDWTWWGGEEEGNETMVGALGGSIGHGEGEGGRGAAKSGHAQVEGQGDWQGLG